jgi:hypothetical protein
VPGFSAATNGRAQLLSLGDTKSLGATMVNEFHLSFMRDKTNLGQPIGGRGVSLAAQGFVNADGSDSIVALDPKGQSVENVNYNAPTPGYGISVTSRSDMTAFSPCFRAFLLSLPDHRLEAFIQPVLILFNERVGLPRQSKDGRPRHIGIARFLQPLHAFAVQALSSASEQPYWRSFGRSQQQLIKRRPRLFRRLRDPVPPIRR